LKSGASPLSPTLPNLALTVDRVFFGRTVVRDRALPGTLMQSQPQPKEMVRLLCSNAPYWTVSTISIISLAKWYKILWEVIQTNIPQLLQQMQTSISDDDG
jgi:hypothetical protein